MPSSTRGGGEEEFFFYFFIFIFSLSFSLLHLSLRIHKNEIHKKTNQGVRQSRDLSPSREAQAGGRPQARAEGRGAARDVRRRPRSHWRPPAAPVENRHGTRVERRAFGPGRGRVPRRSINLQEAY